MGFKARRAGLLPFYEGRRYGYVDSSGRVEIAAQYKNAQPFIHGMAAVKDARWGYLDAGGRLAVPFNFALAYPFSPEGVAVVHKKFGGKNQVFHVDRRGQRLTDEVSLSAGPFQNGLGRMMAADKRWQFIDRDGAVAIGPRAGELGDFREDLAPYAPRLSGSWGYIDRSGEVAIEPAFRSVGAFVDGIAPVTNQKGLLSFIDRRGKTVSATELRVNDFGEITSGLLRVKSSSGSSWVTLEGGRAIDGPFVTAGDFTTDGYAMAATSFDRRGVIDRSGAWVLEPRFWGMGAITDGFAMVYPSDKKRSMYGWVRLSDQKVVWKPAGLEL